VILLFLAVLGQIDCKMGKTEIWTGQKHEFNIFLKIQREDNVQSQIIKNGHT
jgi:hypothetical protein